MTQINAILLDGSLEDSGAQTLDRYEWQTAMAVVDALAAVVGCWSAGGPTSEISIICEVQEDYVVCIDARLELVSVKHRDSSQGAWSFPNLFGDGGIAHLFERWRGLSGRATVRLVTNASPSSGNAAHLAQLCEDLRTLGCGPLTEVQEGLIQKACHKLYSELGAAAKRAEWLLGPNTYSVEFAQIVREFLGALRIDATRTNREDLAFAAPTKYVAPFLQAIGVDVIHAPAVWQQATQLFRPAMHARANTELQGLLTALIDVHNMSADEANQLHAQSRRITAGDLLEVVEVCVALALEPVSAASELAATTLGVKLHHAGLSATTIQLAEDAALRWREYETASGNESFGESALVGQAKQVVHELAASTHEEFNGPGLPTTYGPAMWARLAEQLRPDSVELAPTGLSPSLMFGAMCDLVSQCKVWFSPWFDVSHAKQVFPNYLEEAGANARE